MSLPLCPPPLGWLGSSNVESSVSLIWLASRWLLMQRCRIQSSPPIQFIIIDWGDWLAYVTASTAVKITRRHLRLFCNSLWCLHVLSFDFGGGFHRNSNSLDQLYAVGFPFLFFYYLHFPQLVDPLWLVSADLEAFAFTAWAPYSPAFAKCCFASGKPCACEAQIHSLRCQLEPKSLLITPLGVILQNH